jgi:hypothetical protein
MLYDVVPKFLDIDRTAKLHPRIEGQEEPSDVPELGVVGVKWCLSSFLPPCPELLLLTKACNCVLCVLCDPWPQYWICTLAHGKEQG